MKKIKCKKVSLLAYLFLFSLICKAQSQFTPAWESEEYAHLFTLDFKHSNNLSSTNNAYIAGYTTALQNLILEDPTATKTIELLDHGIAVIEKGRTPEFYKAYYINDLQFFKAFIELKNGSEVKFMWMMNQLYRKSQKLAFENPDHLAAQKLHSIMLILVGSVPEKYEWIFNLLGFKGDTKKGITILRKLGASDSHLKYEGAALYHLVTNYLQPELNEFESFEINEILTSKPDYKLFNLIAGVSSIKQHKSLEARKYLMPLQDAGIPIVRYFLAETYLHEGKYESATGHYQDFIKNTKGESFIKDSYFKLSLMNYISGNATKEDKYKQLAIEQPTGNVEADNNAERLLLADKLAHPDIFRIRFYTDGGFIKEALELIRNIDIEYFSENDKIEYIYRSARAFHLSNKTEEAISLYGKTIQNFDGRYFAPNSALQLGYIYEQKNDLSRAKSYYEKVLEFKNYNYENSIRSKAKSALNNLNNR